MSSKCLDPQYLSEPAPFQKLIHKLNSFKDDLAANESYEVLYRSIGMSGELMLATFNAIILYFDQIHIQAQQNKIQPFIVEKLFQAVTQYLQSQKFQEYPSRDKAIFILEIQTKIGAVLQAFATLLHSSSEKSIVNSSQESYKHVWESIEFVVQKNKAEIRQNYRFMKKIYIMTTAAVMKQDQMKWSISRILCFGLQFPRSIADFGTARLKSLIFFKNPTIKILQSIWNIPQNGFIKKFYKLTLESIAFNKKIYIPFNQLKNDQFPDIYSPSKDSIPVRILNYKNLQMRGKSAKTCCDFSFFKQNAIREKIDTVIIHMHGGGFVSLSSRMMQSMTRRWAKKLKVPIFSIDYRKPPQNPFPAATNDCLAVYRFVLDKVSHYFNIEPTKVYLVGDSAGGNLACSLMGSILIYQLPLPKGIYLAYPTIDIRSIFSPSKVNSLMDPLLWPSMLNLILKEYLGGKIELQSHPLVSPLLLTEAYVGGDLKDLRFPLKWPKTFISTGQKDTFYDNSLILMQKLKQSKIECYCRVYSQLCHGYLRFINSFVGFGKGFETFDILKLNIKKQEHFNQELLRQQRQNSEYKVINGFSFYNDGNTFLPFILFSIV